MGIGVLSVVVVYFILGGKILVGIRETLGDTMQRRKFLRGVAAAGGVAALAGCSFLNSAPPPRRSNAIASVEPQNGALQIEPVDSPWIESRKDTSAPTAAGLLAPLSPIGGARAAKGGGSGGRGATGRGSGGYASAPRTHHGRAWWHGGDYADDWRENHEDEVRRYRASIAAIGVAFLGSDERFEDDRPGAGEVPWDETFQNIDQAHSYEISREGWYRVGAHMVGPDGDADFGWESIDMEIDRTAGGDFVVDEKWKVSPRL
jgi:hypothetical protein